MTTKKNNKLNWIEQVMLKLEGSDKSKVELTYDRAIRELEKRKRNKEALIKTYENELTEKLIDETEKLADFKEEYEASFVTIDVKKIQNTDDRNHYVSEVLFENIVAKKNKVLGQEQKIKDIQESYDNKIKEVKDSIEVVSELIEKF